MNEIKEILNKIASLLRAGTEYNYANKIEDILNKDDNEINLFLVSNDLWGGAGSIADQSLINLPIYREKLEALLLRLSKLQPLFGSSNCRMSQWTDLFKATTKEICTQQLLPEQIDREIEFICRFLANISERAKFMFGIDCNIPEADEWKLTTYPTNQLKLTIDNYILEGKIELGKSEFWIYDEYEQNVFRICDESDIHFISNSKSSLDAIQNAWSEKGIA